MNESLNKKHEFQFGHENLLTERQERLNNKDSKLEIGIPFLDETLGGLSSKDFLLIGAKTGVGKSELANHITLYNLFRGRAIAYFALEAEPKEVERRAKFKLISKLFLERFPQESLKLNYIDWLEGKLDHLTSSVEHEIEQKYQSVFQKLWCFYRKTDFGIEDFEKLLMSVQEKVDLIVIDHLHYFDHDDGNENRAVKEIVKKLRDLALLLSKPIVLVAHLRKTQGKNFTLVPDGEDFHGSSEIIKICTKAITVAPAFDQDEQAGTWPTYMRAVKCRTDGSRTRYVGLLCFNPQKNRYENNYILGKLSPDGSEFIPVKSDNKPKWALSHLDQ